jgi:hypothetical protein
MISTRESENENTQDKNKVKGKFNIAQWNRNAERRSQSSVLL